MGVSAIGERINVQTIRHVLATGLIFLGLFYYFYGPPLTAMLSSAAHRECNDLTGNTYRSYVLEWRTTTFGSLHVPHWMCYDLGKSGHPGTRLGWWVAP